jgi:hypothetical protein
MTTRRLLALAALVLSPVVVSHARQEAGPASEPPLRYRVTVGQETVELEAGRPVTPREGGPTWMLEVLPTRELRMQGAFAFEYPHELAFLGAEGPGGGWWNLTGEGVSVHLQKHFEEPDAVVDRYVESLVAAGAGDVRAVALELDGVRLAGQAFSQRLGGFHGWEADSTQEVFGFTAGGASWLLSLQRTTEVPRGPGGDLFDLAAGVSVDGPGFEGLRQVQQAERVLRLLRESFRFVER